MKTGERAEWLSNRYCKWMSMFSLQIDTGRETLARPVSRSLVTVSNGIIVVWF